MSDRHAFLLVNLATLIWASNITLGRALRADIGPVLLTFFRVLIASLVFAFVLRRDLGLRLFRGWPILVAMAVTGIAGFPVILYWSVQYTTAVNAGFITAVTPLLTLPVAALLLGDRINARQALGMVVSLLGVALIVGVGALAVGVNFGDLLSLFDALVWAFYSVIGRLAMRTRSALAATGAAFMLAVPILVVPAAWEWTRQPPTWTHWR